MLTEENCIIPEDYRPFYFNPVKPNKNRRCLNHDYKAPCLYLLTLMKKPEIPNFSELRGDLDSPYLKYLESGIAIRSAIELKNREMPSVEIMRYKIMPDHIHLLTWVKEYLEKPLGSWIGSFKNCCNSFYREMTGDSFATLFEKDFNDSILKREGQLGIMKDYIEDNPRRLMLKRTFPEYFRSRVNIRLGEDVYPCLGNVNLLCNPMLVQVKISRHWSLSELLNYQARMKNLLLSGYIPISPYINPYEAEIRDFALSNGLPVIQIADNGYTARHGIGKTFTDFCAQGKLLIIWQPEYSTSKITMTYSFASLMNEQARHIAEMDSQLRLQALQYRSR